MKKKHFLLLSSSFLQRCSSRDQPLTTNLSPFLPQFAQSIIHVKWLGFSHDFSIVFYHDLPCRHAIFQHILITQQGHSYWVGRIITSKIHNFLFWIFLQLSKNSRWIHQSNMTLKFFLQVFNDQLSLILCLKYQHSKDRYHDDVTTDVKDSTLRIAGVDLLKAILH